MTLADLMRALVRRWYVVLIVMAAALALAFLATPSASFCASEQPTSPTATSSVSPVSCHSVTEPRS